MCILQRTGTSRCGQPATLRSSPTYILMHMIRLLQYTILVLFFATQIYATPSGDALLGALRDGDMTRARRLVADGAPVNAVDEFGATALMYAALYANSAMVNLLVSRGANLNHADEAGATALMWAIPDESKVRILVERGAQVNVSSRLT